MLLNIFKKAYGSFNLEESHEKATEYVKKIELETMLYLLKRDNKQLKKNKVIPQNIITGTNSLLFVNPIRTTLYVRMAYRLWARQAKDILRKEVNLL